MSETVIVDGVTYRWTTRIEEEDWAGSLSFQYRGLSPVIEHLDVTGDNGAAFSFRWDSYSTKISTWWRQPITKARAVERGVRLGPMQAIQGPDRTFRERLDAATAAIGSDAIAFVDNILGAGCGGADWIREAFDEWLRARTLPTAWLQSILERDGDNDRVYRNRSAIQLLIDTAKRTGLTLVDPKPTDKRLKTRQRENRLPWGLPDSHWWWRQGGATDIDPNDPWD